MKTLDQISLSDQDRRAVEAAAKVLRATLPVDQIILYGSKARGEDRPDSDLDLLVLTSRKLSWNEKQDVVHQLFPLQLEFDVLLSTLKISTYEWEEGLYQVLPIKTEITRDGVIV